MVTCGSYDLTFYHASFMRRGINKEAVFVIHPRCCVCNNDVAYEASFGLLHTELDVGLGLHKIFTMPLLSVLASPKRLPAMLRLVLSWWATSKRNATWLILPVVICLSQRLSHACVSMNK